MEMYKSAQFDVWHGKKCILLYISPNRYTKDAQCGRGQEKLFNHNYLQWKTRMGLCALKYQGISKSNETKGEHNKKKWERMKRTYNDMKKNNRTMTLLLVATMMATKLWMAMVNRSGFSVYYFTFFSFYQAKRDAVRVIFTSSDNHFSAAFNGLHSHDAHIHNIELWLLSRRAGNLLTASRSQISSFDTFDYWHWKP